MWIQNNLFRILAFQVIPNPDITLGHGKKITDSCSTLRYQVPTYITGLFQEWNLFIKKNVYEVGSQWRFNDF